MVKRAPLVGSETPRIWTPPLRDVDHDRSATLGFEVLEFNRLALGIDPTPAQEWTIRHALELNEDGTLRFRYVVVIQGRQNGKSVTLEMVIPYFMSVLGVGTILGLAHEARACEKTWESVLALMSDSDVLGPQLAPPSFGRGSKYLQLGTGEKYEPRPLTSNVGRAFSADFIAWDELQGVTRWAPWAAATHTMMARPNGMVWATATAGDVSSVILRHLRLQAHAALGDPDGFVEAEEDITGKSLELTPSGDLGDLSDGDSEDYTEESWDPGDLFWAEWSAPPGTSKWSRSGWSMANPSMPRFVTEKTLLSAAARDPEAMFLQECMAIWPDTAINGLFRPGDWKDTTIIDLGGKVRSSW